MMSLTLYDIFIESQSKMLSLKHVIVFNTFSPCGELNQTAENVSLDQVVDETYAIIDDRLAYSTQEKAEEMSKELGCEGFHVHELEGQSWYMPCKTHSQK